MSPVLGVISRDIPQRCRVVILLSEDSRARSQGAGFREFLQLGA